MKIGLVEFDNAALLKRPYSQHSYFEPIGIEYIGAYIAQYGHTVKIIQQRHINELDIVRKLLESNCQAVGFSLTSSAFHSGLYVARELKKIRPSVKTIFGGSHPSTVPDIVSDPSIDYVVIGEGEKTFHHLLNNIESHDSPEFVPGIAFWDGATSVTEGRERIIDLDALPLPMRSEEILSECGTTALSYPPPSEQNNVAQICWSRGCPNNCTYCSAKAIWGHKVSFRSSKSVVDELEILKNRFNTNFVFFTDLTFNLNRQKVFELCNEIIRRKIGIHWFAMCIAKGFDDEIAMAMRNAGCSMVAFGLESFNPNTLDIIKPLYTIDTISEALISADKNRLLTRGYIMIGYPWENEKDMLESLYSARNLPIDVLRIAFLTPFPGTTLYSQYKDNLYTDDLTKFTCEEPILRIQSMTSAELIKIRNRMVCDWYQNPHYLKRIRDKIVRYPEFNQSFQEFFSFLKNNGVLI